MEREVAIGPGLAATLGVPPRPLGLVIFAHGSGSSRHSPRNRQVASSLQRAGFATLLADLLTLEEDEVDRITRLHRFDIPLLGRRTVAALRWATRQEGLGDLAIGLFGSSTGAAAALIAAAHEPEVVRAVVSRGGRPDLAGSALAHVRAPTLLVVGGRDAEVIALNREAMRQLPSDHDLLVIEGATHLFEEPGALVQVEDAAVAWFGRYLVAETAR